MMPVTSHAGGMADPFVRPSMPEGSNQRSAAAEDKPAETLQPSKIAYRADIDGLRALAVVPVVLFHAGVEIFLGGFVGVDVFFVISGFLITTGLLQDSSITRFYERRLRRILPALTAMMVTSAIAAFFILLPGDLLAFGKAWARPFCLAQCLFLASIGLFRHYYRDMAPAPHLVAGCRRTVLYLLSLCILVLGRWQRRILPVAIVAMMAVSFWAAQFLVGNMKGVMAFYLMPSRAWELLTGSLLATGLIPGVRHRMIGAAAAAAGVAMIVFSVLTYSAATPFPGVSAIPPVLGSALIIWAGQRASTACRQFWGQRRCGSSG